MPLLSLLTRVGFSYVMQKIFMPEVLKFFILFRSFLLILSQTLLHLFRTADILHCIRITLTPGLAFFHLMTCTLATVQLLLLDRAYSFLIAYPLLSRSLTLTLTTRASLFRWKTPPSIFNVMLFLFALLRRRVESIPFFLCPSSSTNLFILGEFSTAITVPLMGFKGYFRPSWRCIRFIHFLRLPFPQWPWHSYFFHRFSGSHFSLSLPSLLLVEDVSKLGLWWPTISYTVPFSPICRHN